jgi:hypothetical protein
VRWRLVAGGRTHEIWRGRAWKRAAVRAFSQGRTRGRTWISRANPLTPASRFDIDLIVNGTNYRLAVDAPTTLLDALRDRLLLTDTKRGCDLGRCAASTRCWMDDLSAPG